MDSKTSPAWPPAATRYARLAGTGPVAVPGSHDDPPASRAGIRIPPFMTRRRHGMNSQWPLQDFLELGALAGAVPCARLHTRQVLWEWKLRNLGESTELLVAELVTNAVKASRAMKQAFPVRLWLASDSAQVLILVWDASLQPPVRMDTSDEAENGRGLMLVEAISEQWGWYFREDSDGKFVWAIVRLPTQGISYPRR
jgi:anti-sigma regulatory factor (Ser/Thr protein kinase)